MQSLAEFIRRTIPRQPDNEISLLEEFGFLK
jgi:hypothetical protein